MESRPDMSAMGSEDNLAMTLVDQGEPGQSSDDVMTRRLKNRERQRRYRARKRLQAEMKNTENTNSSSPQIQVHVDLSQNVGENRILCKRKWKQDARSAHVAKQQQVVENVPIAKFENNLENFVNQNDSERKAVLGRRHWKADARSKKD